MKTPAAVAAGLAAATLSAPPAIAAPAAPPCAEANAFLSTVASPEGSGVAYEYSRVGRGRVRVDLLQHSAGRRVFAERHVARLGRMTDLGRLRDGIFVVRFATRGIDGRRDVRRVPLRRSGERFRRLPAYQHHDPCGVLQRAALRRPVFGGRGGTRALGASFRLGEPATISVVVRRAGEVVERVAARRYAAGRTHRLRMAGDGRRGRHVVRLRVRSGSGRETVRLAAQRL